jgi:hypothetical protein
MTRATGPAHEARLYRLWMNGSLLTQKLCATNRSMVQVLEPGARNLDAGPDFLDALIRIDGEIIRGDVEIHVQAADWYAHHHDRDPRYNRVILHVVSLANQAGLSARRQNGSLVPTLNLDQYLQSGAEELEFGAYADPGEQMPGSRCALADQTAVRRHATLAHLGGERLRMHAAQFLEMRANATWEQLLYFGELDALGYGKNQNAFRRLANLLPIAIIHDFIKEAANAEALITCEALFFGAAGLLPDRGASEGDAYIARLQGIWRAANLRLNLAPLGTEAWQFFRLRPCNFPTRRIAAAAVLAVRAVNYGFLPGLTAVVKRFRKEPLKGVLVLEELCTVAASGFWASHYDFAPLLREPGARRSIRLLGRGRSREMVINVFLPLLLAFADESEDGRLSTAVRSLYCAYPPLAENEITRQMRRKLFQKGGQGMEEHDVPVLGAALQQGLIQLHKTRCGKNGCNVCL